MWVCKNCGEKVGESFDACWSCRGDRDGAPTDPEPIAEDETEDIDYSDDTPRVGSQTVQESPKKQTEVSYKSTPRLPIIGLILMALGIIGTVIGLGILFMPVFWLGLLLLVASVMHHYSQVVNKDQAYKLHGVMIDGGRGIADELFQEAEKSIVQSEAPNIRIERRIVTAGILGFAGGKRQCMVISNTANPHLKPYKLFLNADDYGINSQVTLYLVYQPDVLKKQ